MRHLFPFYALVLLGLAMTTHASTPAEWIGPSKTERNQWTRYLKSFSLQAVPAQAEARIAVDTKYWLWVNGRLVIREGGLKRGPSPHGTYYDRVDLASYLKTGENTLAILVWHFGKDGFSHRDSGKSGLWFSLEMPSLSVVSDGSWKLSPHPAISTSDDTPPNGRLSEASLRFDARKDEAAWYMPGFPATQWPEAARFGLPPCEPWGVLVERPIPQWKDYGLKDYANSPAFPFEGTRAPVSVSLPYNAHVTPWLQVEAREGLEIDLRTDNFLGGSEPNVHAKYITRGGRQEFEALGWMNGHQVRYTVPAGVKVLGLKFRETGFDTDFKGAFESSDDDLNKLWRKAARTLYVTMRDNYMDCPDRERAQWWGDVVNELGEVCYTFDPRGSLLTKKAIRELVDWARPDGTLYSPVPAGVPLDGKSNAGQGTWNSELPVQMLASVGKYGFWTYYLNTGDGETLRHAYPVAKRYLLLWDFDDDGVIRHRPGDWDWSDWGSEIDARVLDSAWYCLGLEGAIAMARATGNEGDLGEWERRRALLTKNFNRVFWNGQEYRSPEYRGSTDDRANALAVVSGLAEPEHYPELLRVLATQRHASPYMEKYVLEALFLMNAPDAALSRMKERYREQLDSPLTTLWEGWGLGDKGYGGGTYNHAWSGGPLTLLSQYAAGVAPTKPGYEAFDVKPQLGALRRVRAIVPTVKGDIDVRLEQRGEVLVVDLSSPPETEGTLLLPKRDDGTPVISNPSLRRLSDERDLVRFSLPKGRTTFEVRWVK